MRPPASPPSSPTPRAWAISLARESGLQRPATGWWQDPHWRLACLAAWPAWAALGLLAGPAMRAPVGAAAWVSLVVMQPVVEELVVRGLVQGLALDWTGRPSAPWRVGPVSLANLGTTALFVALHLPHQPPAWALAVALPSLVLGHLRERLGSVWPGVLLHAFYNLGFGAVATLVRLHG